MPNAATLHLGNLPFRITEADILQFFAEADAEIGILSVKIPLDRDTGEGRGFAFVEVQGQDLEAALRCNGLLLEGRTVRVEKSQPRRREPGESDRPARGRDQ
jgi:RNA recognition motif-containing protein